MWICLWCVLSQPAAQLEVTARSVWVAGLPQATLSTLSALPTQAKLRTQDGATSAAVRVYFDRNDLAGHEDQPALMGQWRVVGDRLQFQARFPFRGGYDHLLVIQPDADAAPQTFLFSLPAPEKPPPARLTGIFPNADTVPANLLRWYLFFDRPMAHGYAYRMVRVETLAGDVVPAPFVVVAEELWDPSHRRLTLFLDPGRIKRGVGPRQSHGVPLQPGQELELVIDGRWPDAHGSPLGSDVRRRFRVTAEDGRSPRPQAWRLNLPSVGERTPLRIRFDEVLDREQAKRFLALADATDAEVAGSWLVADDGLTALFEPEQPWRPGDYQLQIYSRLEDLAGNNLLQTFDRPITGDDVGGGSHRTITRTFQIR